MTDITTEKMNVLDTTSRLNSSILQSLSPESPTYRMEKVLANNLLNIGISLADFLHCYEDYPITNQVSEFTEECYQSLIENLLKTLRNTDKLVQSVPCNDWYTKDYDSEILPVDFYLTKEGYIEMSTKSLLPHVRASESYRNFFKKKFNDSFQKAYDNCKDTLPRVQKVYMIFTHYYDNTTPLQLVRDCDNYDVKNISDCMARAFVLGSDGPINVRRISLSLKSNVDYTTVTLVPYDKLSTYLEENIPV